VNPVTSLRARRAQARLARKDHWYHPSQVEERSRNGKFTPEAERRQRELLAEGIARHNAGLPADAARPATEPVAVIKTGMQPYAEITGTQLAAYRAAAASETTAPAFTAGRSVAPVTAPMAALPANVSVPPRQARPVPVVAVPDADVLTRVRDGMDRKWRAESFATDRRQLPGFAAMTREYGWQGLHVPACSRVLQYGYRRWTTDRWMVRAMAAIAREDELAHASLDADLRAARERVFAPEPAAGAA
jgi:hypothetical protein